MARTHFTFGYISPQTVTVHKVGETTDRYISHSVTGDQLSVIFDAVVDGQPHEYEVTVSQPGVPSVSQRLSLVCSPGSGTTGQPVTQVSLNGPTTVNSGQSATYSAAADGTDPRTYAWTVTGGTIIGSSTGSSVQVQWGSGTTGGLNVTVSGYANSAIGASQTVAIQTASNSCEGCSASIQSVTGSGTQYTVALTASDTAQPYLLMIRNSQGTLVSQLNSSSLNPVITLPTGTPAGTYTAQITSQECPSCQSQPFTFTVQVETKPVCERGPSITLVTVQTPTSLYVRYDGVNLQTINWTIKQGSTSVASGNSGQLTTNSFQINLTSALTNGNYVLELQGAECTTSSGAANTQSFSVITGTDPDPDPEGDLPFFQAGYWFGNSFTKTPPINNTQWQHTAGMAADSEEQDYAHLMAAAFRAVNPNFIAYIESHGSPWETEYRTRTYDYNSRITSALNATYGGNPPKFGFIYISILENVNESQFDKTLFFQELDKVIDRIPKAPTFTVLTRNSFWSGHSTSSAAMEEYASLRGYKFVSFTDVQDQYRSDYGNDGINAHYNNEGHALIAQRSLNTLRSTTNPPIPMIPSLTVTVNNPQQLQVSFEDGQGVAPYTYEVRQGSSLIAAGSIN